MSRRLLALGLGVLMVFVLVVPALAQDPGVSTSSNTTTQAAANTAVLQQTVAGVSGDAAATTSGYAESGSVDASAKALQAQIEIQAVANLNPWAFPDTTVSTTNNNAQGVSNTAAATQSGVAMSGDAAAETSGVAKSGWVDLDIKAAQIQANGQIIVNATAPAFFDGTQTATNRNTQTAGGLAGVSQTGAAISGDVAAELCAQAYSGWVDTDVQAAQVQGKLQVIFNHPSILHGGPMAATY